MPPVVQSLEELYAQYNPVYDQSRALYNQQLSAIPGKYQGQVAGLGVAQQNAFRDINTGANSKGMAFSGVPAAEQMRYTGEKYLPALAALQNQQNTETFQLQQAIAGLNSDQRLKAMETRSGQQKSLDQYLQAERDRQFQLQLQREQMAAQRASRAADTIDLSLARNKEGGYTVMENGKASTNYDLNAYARATGKNIVDLLANGDAKDRQAAAWYYDKIRKYGTADQAKYLDELKRDRSTAFYLGG
jgi:hypothetical protein